MQIPVNTQATSSRKQANLFLSLYLAFFSVESKCNPERFTADDVLCHDPQSSLFNKEKVKKFSTCSLITSYQFASNGSMRHTMLTSGTNSMLLKEYDGHIEIEVYHKS